jgi:hypothetical protein
VVGCEPRQFSPGAHFDPRDGSDGTRRPGFPVDPLQQSPRPPLKHLFGVRAAIHSVDGMATTAYGNRPLTEPEPMCRQGWLDSALVRRRRRVLIEPGFSQGLAVR